MRILLHDTTLYGPPSPFFVDGVELLKRNQECDYQFVDEGEFLKPLQTSLVHKVAYRILGRRPLTYWALNRALLESARRFRPHLVLIGKGAYVSPSTLRSMKEETRAKLINYATDDPFNPVVNTSTLLKSLSLYDLIASTKRAIIYDLKKAGCENVVYIQFGYQPSIHFPEQSATAEESARFASDVVFLGGCDRDRIPFFEALVRAIPDLRLQLYGRYWDRHPVLRRYARGMALGRDFRLALGGATIAINLVRRANRDGHVMRTFEIPACGVFMLTERTDEHLELFEEDKEVVYFGSPDEMIDKVRFYLAHESPRKRIADAGYRKILAGRHTYTDRLFQILDAAGMLARQPVEHVSALRK